MKQNIACPYCGGIRTIGKGVRRTKENNVHQIRRCKACNRRFTAEPVARGATWRLREWFSRNQ